jgi:hypothetical protein
MLADEGALGRNRLQAAVGDQPLIGQQHGNARDGELLGQHPGGRHARARLQPAGGDQLAQLVIELLLQRLVAYKLQRDQQDPASVHRSCAGLRAGIGLRLLVATTADRHFRRSGRTAELTAKPYGSVRWPP